MIFTELVLHNFGIYRGRHLIDLKPKSAEKPIILLGGLNGGGKTTFLDALQLVLYGSRANCSNRGELSYSEYLKQAVNRYSNKLDGASVELAFLYFNQGQEIEYRVRRIWKDTGKRIIQDKVEVVVGGQLDKVLSSNWAENVESFIPKNISSLFFFDGEKIEDLATPESAANIIKTGIQSLLGLDMVDKLSVDLKTIKRKRIKASAEKGTEELISKLEHIIDVDQLKLKDKISELAAKVTEIDNLRSQRHNYKESYKTHGGELFDKKEAIEAKHKNSVKQIELVSGDIKKFAEGVSPLLLVENLLYRAKNQVEKEQLVASNISFLSELKKRDEKVLIELRQKNIGKETLKLLTNALLEDMCERQKAITGNNYLKLGISSFSHINERFFSVIKNDSKSLLEKYDSALEELSQTEKELSSIPESGLIQEISQQIININNKLILCEEEKARLSKDVEQLTQQINSKQNELDRAFHHANDTQLSEHRNKQILLHTDEVKTTLEYFRKALINKHIGHLESLIEDSFKSLVRKHDLIQKVSINSESFVLDILNKDGNVIPTNRLSAGERQLLAISVLWGLAKASGRPLPTVIDTPLGRLDRQHRNHLINNYFPNASHQVILLSTDTEIDSKYRDILQRSIGKEYHIEYSAVDKTSTVMPGYF